METHRPSECNVKDCSSSSDLMPTQNYFDHKIKGNTSALQMANLAHFTLYRT
jgi:hypothetical protein